MQTKLAQIDRSEVPWFVTLTWHEFQTEHPSEWKAKLDTFGKWILRLHPTASLVWKLEPQKRGAPHYHLLLFGCPWLSSQAVAYRWWDILGRQSEDHLLHGTRVERARSGKAVMAYASKKYMGKEVALPDSWRGVGRLWGVIGRLSLPITAPDLVPLTKPQKAQFRRILARFLWSQKGMPIHGCKQRLFTGCPEEWLRLAREIGGTYMTPEGGFLSAQRRWRACDLAAMAD